MLSCHDISDGGILVSLSEMILGGEADGKIGASVNLDFTDLATSKSLFSESSGFVFEVKEENVAKVKSIFEEYKLNLKDIGKTGRNKLNITKQDKEIINLSIEDIKKAWTSGVVEAMK